MERHYNKPILN